MATVYLVDHLLEVALGAVNGPLDSAGYVVLGDAIVLGLLDSVGEHLVGFLVRAPGLDSLKRCSKILLLLQDRVKTTSVVKEQ